MSVVKKGMLIVGAPLTLAAMLGGAVAFANQSGGSSSSPDHGGHSTYHRVTFGPGPNDGPVSHDGSDCPRDKGGETPVSPSVY